jgi:hypothetical protein
MITVSARSRPGSIFRYGRFVHLDDLAVARQL